MFATFEYTFCIWGATSFPPGRWTHVSIGYRRKVGNNPVVQTAPAAFNL